MNPPAVIVPVVVSLASFTRKASPTLTVAVPLEYPTVALVPPATITAPLLDAELSSTEIVTLPVAPLTSIPSPATAVAT